MNSAFKTSTKQLAKLLFIHLVGAQGFLAFSKCLKHPPGMKRKFYFGINRCQFHEIFSNESAFRLFIRVNIDRRFSFIQKNSIIISVFYLKMWF